MKQCLCYTLLISFFSIYSTKGRLQFQDVIGMVRMPYPEKTVHLLVLIKNMQKLKIVSS